MNIEHRSQVYTYGVGVETNAIDFKGFNTRCICCFIGEKLVLEERFLDFDRLMIVLAIRFALTLEFC